MSKARDHGASLATAMEPAKTRAPRPRLDRPSSPTRLDRAKAGQTTVTPSPRAAVVVPPPGLDRPKVEPAPQETDPVALKREATVVIPREFPTEREAPAGHRICPSPISGHAALLRQTIGLDACNQRQCGGYHKCATCSHAEVPQWSGSELDAPGNGPSALARDRSLDV